MVNAAYAIVGPAPARFCHQPRMGAPPRRTRRRLGRHRRRRGFVRRRARGVGGPCSAARQPSACRDLNIFTWFPVAGLHANVGLLVDPLSMTMALFVTGVSTAIHMYSIGLHAPGPRVRPVLRLPQPVPLFDGRPGPGGQFPVLLPRLGGGRFLFVRPGGLLVPARGRRRRGQEGLRHQPCRATSASCWRCS